MQRWFDCLHSHLRIAVIVGDLTGSLRLGFARGHKENSWRAFLACWGSFGQQTHTGVNTQLEEELALFGGISRRSERDQTLFGSLWVW